MTFDLRDLFQITSRTGHLYTKCIVTVNGHRYRGLVLTSTLDQHRCEVLIQDGGEGTLTVERMRVEVET